MRNYGVDYPGFVNPPDAAYPYSSPKNATTDTAEDGTPVEEKWVGDVWGFNQSVMSEAGVTPNGQTESVSNPQILTALKSVIESDGKTYREARPLNNDWNGYLDPAHQGQLPSPDGYPATSSAGGTVYALNDEWSINCFSGSSSNTISSDAEGVIFSGSIYKKYEYTAEQIALIDENKIPVFIKAQDGKSFYFKNGDVGVTVSKSGTTLTVTISAAIFGVTGINKVWRFFVTDKAGSVVELSPDVLANSVLSSKDFRLWINETSSRTLGVVYTNSKPYPIKIKAYSSLSTTPIITITVDGDVIDSSDTNISFSRVSAEAIVPSGSSYAVNITNANLEKWSEYK